MCRRVSKKEIKHASLIKDQNNVVSLPEKGIQLERALPSHRERIQPRTRRWPSL